MTRNKDSLEKWQNARLESTSQVLKALYQGVKKSSKNDEDVSKGHKGLLQAKSGTIIAIKWTRIRDYYLLHKSGIRECRGVNGRINTGERNAFPFSTIPTGRYRKKYELENHHLSASIITGSGKTHQRILKLDKVWGVTVYLQSLELILLKDTY